MALLAPLLIALAFGTVDVAWSLHDEIGMETMVRSAARFASENPESFIEENGSAADVDTIEGVVQADANATVGPFAVTNQTSGSTYISVDYWDTSSKECGEVGSTATIPANGTTPGWVEYPGYTGTDTTEATCTAAGNIVEVTVGYTYNAPVLSSLLPHTLTLTKSDYETILG